MGIIHLLFFVFFLLFFVVMLKTVRLEKGSKVTQIFIHISMFLLGSYIVLWIADDQPLLQNIFLGCLLSLENIGLTFGIYAIYKNHRRKLKVTLISNAIFILFYDICIQEPSVISIDFTKIWKICILLVEINLIINNYFASRMLSMMGNRYKFLNFSGKKWIVNNELPIEFGKNNQNYNTIGIPVLGYFDSKEEDIDQKKYVIHINNELYEIREDFPTGLGFTDTGGKYVILTINERPLRFVTNNMKNVLT